MKTLLLDGTWEPRSTYNVTHSELESRKAINANNIWTESHLKLCEKQIPELQDDEILIRVKACGICGSDTHCFEKDENGYMLFSGSVRLPVIPGHEFSGEILEVGKKVTSLKVGDAVTTESIMWCGICEPCRSGNFNQCQHLDMLGFSAPGGFAEYAAIKEKYCWKLNSLKNFYKSDQEIYDVGALIEPIGCAYNGIFIAGNGLNPGAYVTIYGAGPIGLSSVLLARISGAAKIIVFDISEPRNKLALELGADYAANPITLIKDGSSPSEFVRQITKGYGVDLQIEAAGAVSSTIPEINKSFAPNGKMVFLGRQDNHAHLDFNTLVSQANQITGARGHAGHGIYPRIIRLLSDGRLPAHKLITSRFPFEQILDAFKQSVLRHDGKIMICFS